MKLRNWILGACLAFGAGTGASAATLDGLTVTVASPFLTCRSVTVGDGTECAIYDREGADGNAIFVDIGPTNILFSFADISGNSTFSWSNSVNFPNIFDIVISGLTGFTLKTSDYTAIGVAKSGSVTAMQSGADQITASFNALTFDGSCDNGGTLCATLELNRDASTVAAVPLPASLPLLLAGLGGIGLMRRKRKAA